MKAKSLLSVLLLVLISTMAFANGQQEAAERELPAPPPFSSAASADDEGAVKPIKASEEPLKIAVLGLENNPFWIPVKEGAFKAAEELKSFNCTVEWIVPSGTSHGASVFGTAIESAMIQEYDAIATIAGDSGIVPYINKAVDAGIPVATFNSETDTENKRVFFVGADLYQQGQRAGQYMAEALGGQGKVGVITGFFSVEAHELRRLGFEDYLEENAPGIEIVDRVENQDQADIAYSLSQDMMTANTDLSAIYVTAGGPFGVAAAVEDAKKVGAVKIICYDFVDETMEYVQKGVITGTIGQGPFAQGHDPAVRLFNYIVAGEVPEAGRLLTEAAFVTKDNISKYWSK
ncbi:MAG: substrate-binding domain-containing protein [Spirochaetales bacterium]|nr:substrate-binding domain-containing protein [Spirochaetales bacterium]